MRTAFANPASVVSGLAPLPLRELTASSPSLRKLAASAPGSQLAADLDAGVAGLTVMRSVVNTLTAIVIPAYMDSARQRKGAQP